MSYEIGQRVELQAGQYTRKAEQAERGRYAGHTPNAINELAFSIRKNGQLQEVGITPDGVIVWGNGRADAVEMVRNGFEGPDGKQYPGIPDFALRAIVVDPKDDFVKTVEENVKRNNLSPVDQMIAIQHLRDNVYTQPKTATAKICQLFGKDKTWVSRVSSLSKLPKVALDMVHAGEENGGFSMKVGVELAKESNGLSEDDIVAMCNEPHHTKESILTVAKVEEFVRTRDEKPAETPEGEAAPEGEQTAEGEAKESKPKESKQRTLKQVLEFIAKFTDKNADDFDSKTGRMLTAVHAYATGISEDTCVKNIKKVRSEIVALASK